VSHIRSLRRARSGGALLLLATSFAAGAADEKHARWFRDPALCPDGRFIAFRSDGDLYVAPSGGGEARLLRGTGASEIMPVWLPGGREIAYAADAEGGFDVYVIASDGTGEPRRLTSHSRDEVPVAVSPDGTRLLIRSGRLELSGSQAAYPMNFNDGEEPVWPRQWAGLQALPLDGGLPEALIEPVSLEGGWSADGALAFSVRPGSETVYRKHEKSPAAWDIWLREKDGRGFRQLTRFDGHDRSPVISRADGRVYYLSERSGSFNVWRMPLEGDSVAEQITRHEGFPVRGLSISDDGTLAYSYRGELHAGNAAGVRKLSIRLPRREPKPAGLQTRDLAAEINAVTLSPSGREAVVATRGEVYAVERGSQRWRKLFSRQGGVKTSPTFSADGRSLLVVRDAGSASDLLLARRSAASVSWLEGDEPRAQTLAAGERGVILAAALAPAGDQAVYSTGDRLNLIPVKGGAPRVVLTREQGLSEDRHPIQWHPTGAALTLPWRNLRRMSPEVAVLDLASGELLNLSQSGFVDKAPQWSADGRSLLWLSDRHGLRQFKAGESTLDVQAIFLDVQRQRARERKAAMIGEPASASELHGWLRAFEMDPALRSDRRERLTADSGAIDAVALAPSGRFLLRLQSSSAGQEVWRQPLPEGQAVKIAVLPDAGPPREYFGSTPSLQIGTDESAALLLADGAAHWVDTTSGGLEKVVLSGVPAGDAAAERRWVLERVARNAPRVFYRPERLKALRWTEHVAESRRLLPAVSEPGEFVDLMQELVGELDSSHTFFERSPLPVAGRTGSLGVIYDTAHSGAGLKLAEILRNSPLANASPESRAGDVITAINGKVVPARTDSAEFLAGTVGEITRVTLRSADGSERTVDLKPVDGAGEAALFYARWADARRALTGKLSGGRLGYVHMPWMGEDTVRPVIEDVLGRYADAEGIVLDLRYNQGGWIHEPLVSFFSLPFAFDLRSYGVVYASEPATRAGRPIVTLVNEASYSNGFEIPRLLREHGLSRLVGRPIPGTGLGWHDDPLPYWEYGYGVAHDASQTREGEDWEGPVQAVDVEVVADRAALREGRDPQLEAAVRDLLETLGKGASR
jgi:tricorn protease